MNDNEQKTTEKIPEGRVDLLLEKLSRDRIGSDTKMQCKVCWWIYDPEEGREEWDIPPGTPFTELPEHFTCPGCGNDKSVFLVHQE